MAISFNSYTRPRETQGSAPTTKGKGLEEAALTAVDDSHKKAAGESLGQKEARSRQPGLSVPMNEDCLYCVKISAF